MLFIWFVVIVASFVAWYVGSNIAILEFSNNIISINYWWSKDWWLTFLWVICTLFSVFFVYSWFKIDNTVIKIEEDYNNIKDLKRKSEKIIENIDKKSKEIVKWYCYIQLNYWKLLLENKKYKDLLDYMKSLENDELINWYIEVDIWLLYARSLLLIEAMYKLWKEEENIEYIANSLTSIDNLIEKLASDKLENNNLKTAVEKLKKDIVNDFDNINDEWK